MLVITTWLWGQKYDAGYVRKLRAGIERHLKEPHRFLCITDGSIDGVETTLIKDPGLTKHKGCLVRLRLFDDVWQRDIGVQRGDRIVNCDLDAIVTGPLDALFCRADTFMILTGANAANPCPYNGSIFMFRAGCHVDIWREFTLQAVAKVPFYEFPDDQAWFAHKVPGAVGWKVGKPSGIYAYQKPGWPKGEALPSDARLVVFPGSRDPSKVTHLPWVAEHWQ